ncbi:MAG: hypothetical protein WCQ99_15090 [Pseudomonadota bacterium]
MTLAELLADKKTITVSGLYSGIGKTMLSEYILSTVRGIAAVKITMTDGTTLVSDEEAAIMVEGKDTFRFKARGAQKVVWIRSTEDTLKKALQEALALLGDYQKILLEGNSLLSLMTPCLAVFLCDEKIIGGPIKPGRVTALKKADIIFHNIRSTHKEARQEVEAFCKKINQKARVIPVNIQDESRTMQILTSVLREWGFL